MNFKTYFGILLPSSTNHLSKDLKRLPHDKLPHATRKPVASMPAIWCVSSCWSATCSGYLENRCSDSENKLWKISCSYPRNTLQILLKTQRRALKPFLVTKLMRKTSKLRLNVQKTNIFRLHLRGSAGTLQTRPGISATEERVGR